MYDAQETSIKMTEKENALVIYFTRVGSAVCWTDFSEIWVHSRASRRHNLYAVVKTRHSANVQSAVHVLLFF